MSNGFSVVNNLSSLQAQNNLTRSGLDRDKTLSRLSSGLRIINAGDDAAGLAIANALSADSAALGQAARNANDGIGITQIADGALSSMSGMLERAVTLATQSASETVGTTERQTIDTEYKQILSEIDRTVNSTSYKGEHLFSESGAVTKSIYVGDTRSPSAITVSVAGSNGAGSAAMGLQGTSLRTPEGARQALGLLQDAIGEVSQWRGALGAQSNRIMSAVENIQVQHQNITAAESTIRDANMADEMVKLTRSLILQKSGMASLAQANASSQLVLSLFG